MRREAATAVVHPRVSRRCRTAARARRQRSAAWLLVGFSLSVSFWDPRPAPAARERVVIGRDPARTVFQLQAEAASPEELAQALERATGCVVEFDERLRERRISLAISTRPADRLFTVLARRLNARLEVRYRFEPAPAATRPEPGSLVMAGRRVSFRTEAPADLAEVLQELSIRAELAEGVRGTVRVSAPDLPLGRVLDQIAAQVGARWRTVVRLEPRVAVDAAAAEEERGRHHFGDLARLSSAERQEEIAVDLADMLRLPDGDREQALARRADDILGMGQMLKETPGEHRAPVLDRIQGIGGDYLAVLSRLPRDLQTETRPLLHALRQLDRQLGEIR